MSACRSAVSSADVVTIDFLEGSRPTAVARLRDCGMMRHQVTPFYREQMRASGYYQQLKHIVEPSIREFDSRGKLDTSGESENTVVPGLQHKYAQTGLILVTDRCAAYCRYCFRKRLVGKDTQEVALDYDLIANYIVAHPEMNNVLLSGGDPFVLSTERLTRIVDRLLPIPHLSSIRFGTKAIAFYPPRFADPTLVPFFERILEAGKTPVLVTHFDHIGEISEESERNIRRLRQVGVQFLNQAVLLARVNDDPAILAATFEKCHAIGARPYYLFQARPVMGASHFQVPFDRGVQIVRGVKTRLSGIQKTFRFIMSHDTGKIEILDAVDGRLYLLYHQSKDAEKVGRLFSRRLVDGAGWLDDLPED